MIQEEPQSFDDQPQVNPFWPIFIATLSFLILIGYQFSLVFQQRMGLQKQIQQQAEVVTRAAQTQNELQRIVTELMALADAGDNDAKTIVAKYKITNTQPAAPAK